MGNCITSSNIGAVKASVVSVLRKYTGGYPISSDTLSILNFLPQYLYICKANGCASK